MSSVANADRINGSAIDAPRQTLRLLSYNIQVGMGYKSVRDYVTQGWKHFLPHARVCHNLNNIARLISKFDVIALQEADGGSLRSGFINQTEYLAKAGHFPFWHNQINRNFGHFAQHSNGLISRVKPVEITYYKLPGLIPGRGAMMVRFGSNNKPLILLIMHLSLGQRTRQRQMIHISQIVRSYEHVIVMGDMNCQPNSPEMDCLLRNTDLCEPVHGLKTFPSWRPVKKIDHILVTPALEISDVHVLNYPLSDHLPIAMDIHVPADVGLL